MKDPNFKAKFFLSDWQLKNSFFTQTNLNRFFFFTQVDLVKLGRKKKKKLEKKFKVSLHFFPSIKFQNIRGNERTNDRETGFGNKYL